MQGAVKLLSVTCPLLLLSSFSTAQNVDQNYRTPPLDIADIVDAQPTPSVSIDPAKNWMLLLGRPGLPTITELSHPELRIAGMRQVCERASMAVKREVSRRGEGLSKINTHNSATFKNT